MLYLPTIYHAEKQVRLTAFSDDIELLCANYCDESSREHLIIRAMFTSPGILLFAAAKYFESECKSLGGFSELSDWIKTSMFAESVEPKAFTYADSCSLPELASISKWQQKPTRKRLVKYLSAATTIDRKSSKQLVNQLFSKRFRFETMVGQFCLGTQKAAAAKEAAQPAGNEDLSHDHATVSQLWQACTRLHDLQTRFASEVQAQKMSAMKQLAYGASHEINNPLANIATRAQALMLDEKLPSRRQKLALIYAQAMRAHEMISDMMLFANPPDAIFETNEPSVVIQQVIDELGTELKAADVSIRIRQYPDVPLCEFDSTQLAVAVKAMIQNALIAIGHSGEIRVQIWRRVENKIAISISNNGVGLASDAMDKLFDPFYSGREAGRGLGFGLSKAWRIVELHGGELIVDRDFEGGTRFVMTMPIKQPISQNSSSRIDNVRAA